MEDKPDKFNEIFKDDNLERPLECSECKKNIAIHYTKIIDNKVTHQGMCQDCPALQRNLGYHEKLSIESKASEGETGLCCLDCGTTLELVRQGQPLGCSHCYEVFSDVISREILASKIANDLKEGETPAPQVLHMGHRPGENVKVTPSMRLMALTEALNETLSNEDYEQAAAIRDQISELKSKKDHREEGDVEKK